MTKEEQIVELVDELIERRKHVLVHSLALIFKDRLRVDEDLWVPITSLSSLRAQVGGRFQNLKNKWIASGLPLKENRGDSLSEYKLETENWLLLKQWIEKRGFEVRLGGENIAGFFEVKVRKSS